MFSRCSLDVLRMFAGFFQDVFKMLRWVLWDWWNLMIISNESMDLNDPKELDDPQLFDDPSYLVIPSYSMIPSHLMILSYSMINWKYGLWQSKSLRWYLHNWWSCFYVWGRLEQWSKFLIDTLQLGRWLRQPLLGLFYDLARVLGLVICQLMNDNRF